MTGLLMLMNKQPSLLSVRWSGEQLCVNSRGSLQLPTFNLYKIFFNLFKKKLRVWLYWYFVGLFRMHVKIGQRHKRISYYNFLYFFNKFYTSLIEIILNMCAKIWIPHIFWLISRFMGGVMNKTPPPIRNIFPKKPTCNLTNSSICNWVFLIRFVKGIIYF